MAEASLESLYDQFEALQSEMYELSNLYALNSYVVVSKSQQLDQVHNLINKTKKPNA
ncbi:MULTISPECIES: aspartyl-phosphate phosphatase Spo0E family protein [Paenibacillus]|uniref:aspartyl-phosphate phosphatase Spo0E family protein n=1 Tax=Paenibacillus TaxID=44249 RepID=UPI0009D73F38|nr:aspartyl-phosphate phosphatase Spo0E family protein [Paenibacillus odorifer]